jgi:hypothetical protein
MMHFLNSALSKRAKMPPKVLYDGIPSGNSQKGRNQSSFASHHSSISVKRSAPQIVAKTPIAIISTK